MRPALLFVHDPHPGRAAADVAALCARLPLEPHQPEPVLVRGADWAAALLPPQCPGGTRDTGEMAVPRRRPLTSCAAPFTGTPFTGTPFTGDPCIGETPVPLDSPRCAKHVSERPCRGGVSRVPHPEGTATIGCDLLQADDGHVLLWTGDPGWPIGETLPISPRDTSIRLLAGLRRQGPSETARYDHAFAGAWYQPDRRAWTIFNDRHGQSPLFWHCDGQRLVVAPLAWLTWLGSRRPLELAEEGVIDVLRTTNTQRDHTLIRGVHWLEPGDALDAMIRSDRLHVRPFRTWQYPLHADKYTSPDDAAEAYLAAMTAVLRRDTAGEPAIRLGITGGMDTRMILAVCERIGVHPDCYTIGWPTDEDVRFGRRLAHAAGCSHTPLPVLADTVLDHLPAMIAATDGLHAAGHFSLAAGVRHYLSQNPGGVILEGYLHGVAGSGAVPNDDELRPGLPAHQHPWAIRHAHRGLSPKRIGQLLAPDLAERSFAGWASAIDDAWQAAPRDDPYERAEFCAVNGRCGRIDVPGVNMMRGYARVRSPGTAAALLDWYSRVPGTWRRGKAMFARVLDRQFPRLARVPRTHTGGICLSSSRFWREVAWQREKLHRAFQHWRGRPHPVPAIWLFQELREHGRLNNLLAPDAVVFNWVRREVLADWYRQADADPSLVTPLLALWTVETMAGQLRSMPPLRCSPAHQHMIPPPITSVVSAVDR